MENSSISPLSRSIPAPAGEPDDVQRTACRGKVYPRACGGTRAEIVEQMPIEGLSPRLRGNLVAGLRGGEKTGSIPAPAGEPHFSSQALGASRVYPRACGGTITHSRRRAHGQGLSPRLRGNPDGLLVAVVEAGSIPAPAGEPIHIPISLIPPRVYPRACGGTALSSGTVAIRKGLSPRLRGNHPRSTALSRR